MREQRKGNYVFMPKSTFEIKAENLLALVIFNQGEAPEFYLIPATAWATPNAMLVGRDYTGLKSAPEWGLTISTKTRPLLQQYAFDAMIGTITGSGPISPAGPGCPSTELGGGGKAP